MTSNINFIRAVFGSLLILIADQLVKLWILKGLELPEVGSIEIFPFLSFTMIWNKGISLGIGLDEWVGKAGLIVLTIIIVGVLVRWMMKTERVWEIAGLSLVVGGAFSNLIDRFVHGAVVDFVHLHVADYSFYVFNVADAAITIGVLLMIYDSLRSSPEEPTTTPVTAGGKEAAPSVIITPPPPKTTPKGE